MTRRVGDDQLPASHLLSLLGDWSAADPSLYMALAQSLERLIQRGDIPPGAQLPAERTLAAKLAVSRGTVMHSYERLRLRGFLSSRQGSGSQVRVDAPRPLLADQDSIGPSAPSRSLFGRLIDDSDDVVDLAVSSLHDAQPLADALLPRTWHELEAVSRGHGYVPAGLPALRSQICQYYLDRGLRTTPDQVTVTGGAQQALDLVASLALRPGDRVLLESPTYPGAIDVFSRHGARVETFPFSSHWDDPTALRRAVAAHAPRLVYLMPGLHNPVGRGLPDGRRRAIARLLDDYELYVVEDNTLADVAFDPRDHALLASYARRDRVLTLGSLSKTAWGGLRVGWMRSDPALAARAARIKAARDLSLSPLPQVVAARILAQFDDVLRQRREQLHGRCRILESELSTHLPDWRWSHPEGGLSLWVQVPFGDANEFSQLALRRGVAVLSGSAHCLDASADDRLRIAFSAPADVLVEGVRRLQQAWEEYCRSTGYPPPAESAGEIVDLTSRLSPARALGVPEREARRSIRQARAPVDDFMADGGHRGG